MLYFLHIIMPPVTIERLTGDQIPSQLREIPKPPQELYIRGALPDTNPTTKYITMVGSRNHTRYAVDVIKHLVSGLAGHPIVIVSGLALGIDAIVHEQALAHNIPTIAFPGSGLAPSVLYPASNRGLAERILQNNGTLLSGFTPETPAAQWTFPTRNRLMAGMSDITVVIEAEIGSGTRITANLALEYNRTVGAVPGNIFSTTSHGCHALLRQGAVVITSPNDILTELGLAEFIPFKPDDSRLRDATEQELAVLEFLREPRTRNEISRHLNIPISEIGMVLGVMELKSYIVEEFGEVRRTA